MSFVITRTTEIPRLRGTLYEVVHEPTGARVVHLEVPDRNSHFCALYSTPPPDSTGVPHVMEHCVSGGSRRFVPGQGGDMYNRSLLTDVNGTTNADFTNYYFSTRNETDFANWLDYVVDVSLHPRMERDTFLRHSGHIERDDADGYRFVGTVYNEMMASNSTPVSRSSLALKGALFPGHPYGESSGGVPFDVSTLTFQETLDFKAKHYNATNGCYVSRGAVPLAMVLAGLGDVLADAPPVGERVPMPPIPQLTEPVVTEAAYPASEADAGGLGRVSFGWVTRPVASSHDRLALEVLADVLFNAPNAPVRTALEATGLVHGAIAAQVAPWSRIAVFLGCEGVAAEDADALDAALVEALEKAAAGLDVSLVNDVIARIELSRRDPETALQTYMAAVVPALLHDGDVAAALAFDDDLARLRREPLEGLIRSELLDNPHRARVTMRPDPELVAREDAAQAAWVQEQVTALDAAGIEELTAQVERMNTAPSFEFARRGLTPETACVELTDLGGEAVDGSAVTLFEQPTDGLVHLGLRFDLTGLDEALVPYLGVYAAALEQAAQRSGRRVAGLRATTHARVTPDGARTLHWLELGATGLARESAELLGVIEDVVGNLDADVAHLASERLGRQQRRIVEDGQVNLRRLAGRELRRASRYEDLVKGYGQTQFLRALPADAPERLHELHASVIVGARAAASLTGEPSALAGFGRPAADLFGGLPTGVALGAAPDDLLGLPAMHHARITPLPVAFTCEVHDCGGLLDPDAPVIAVIGQLVFAGGMNTRIRQGGAYGVDYDTVPERGVFWISSRRDPLPLESFAIMSELIGRVADGAWDGPPAEDGKLAVLRVTDPVDSPASAARRAWLASFTGHTADMWNAYRRAVVAVTDDQLADVAGRRLLTPRRATSLGDALYQPLASNFDETLEV